MLLCTQLKGVRNLIVYVRDNNVEQAMRALKKKLQREGIFKELKNRKYFETRGQIAARKRNEANRRYKKLNDKNDI